MSVIAHIVVPPDEFTLGQTLCDHDRLRAEFERSVPFDDGVAPAVRVTGAPVERVAPALGRDDHVERVEYIDHSRETVLVSLTWPDRVGALVETMARTNVTCLDGVGRADGWRLTLRFPSREALSRFYRACTDRGVTPSVTRVADGLTPKGWHASTLSDRQYDTLRVAFETGYFAIPRDVTLQELATAVGVSDTAASQRVRRGLRRLLAAEFDEAGGRPGTASVDER